MKTACKMALLYYMIRLFNKRQCLSRDRKLLICRDDKYTYFRAGFCKFFFFSPESVVHFFIKVNAKISEPAVNAMQSTPFMAAA